MTMTAGGTAETLHPGDAGEVLREMAAVIRTVFGAGLQASRQVTPPVAAQAEPQQPQFVVTTPEPPAAAPAAAVAPAAAAAPAAPASIPMPSIPLPDLPTEAVSAAAETEPATETADTSAENDEPVEADEAPAAYTGEVPTLRLVPNAPAPSTPAAPIPAISVEHRQAVLREVAFLDDI